MSALFKNQNVRENLFFCVSTAVNNIRNMDVNYAYNTEAYEKLISRCTAAGKSVKEAGILH